MYEVTALSRAKLKPVADIRILIAETEFHIRGLNEVGQGRLSAHKKLTPPMGLLLLARLHGQPIGCGALKFHQRRPAELKRTWIAPAARGAGVARRLLGELERTAREAGAVVLPLETNRALSEAIALYKRSGYVEVKAFNAEPYAPAGSKKRLGRKR